MKFFYKKFRFDMRRDNNRTLHIQASIYGRKFRNNVMLLISSHFNNTLYTILTY